MERPHEKQSAHRPHKGDRVTYRGAYIGLVSRVEESLCYVDTGRDNFHLFIWAFSDGINDLHTWTKT